MTKERLIILVLAAVIIFTAFVFDRSETSGKLQTAHSVIPVSPIPVLATTTPREIRHGDTSKKQVIFTFDGGGTIQSGDKILEILAEHHVTGTFFLTGKMIETNPDFVKRITSAGHEIFNHTYDHLNLITLSNEKIATELSKMENILQTTTGVSSKPYFRVPYGFRDVRVLEIAARNGYQSVYWTVDAGDWVKDQGETAVQVKNRILSSIAPGNIYLMHVGGAITGEILDDVFTMIESKGYRIVSLTQGL